MRQLFPDIDYVFISYYQDDNYSGAGANRKPIVPSPAQWANVFQKLHGFYPRANFGFGEVSPQCYYLKDDKKCKLYESDDNWNNIENKKKCDRGCPCCVAAQAAYIKRYYTDWDKEIRVELKKSKLENLYVGGYFYWYFKQDAVNRKNAAAIEAFRKAFAGWY